MRSPTPSATKPRIFREPTLLGLVALATVLVLGALVIGGVPVSKAVLLVIGVVAQSLSGVLMWQVLTQGRSNPIELIGVGLSFGSLTAVISASTLRLPQIVEWAWLLPSGMSTIAILSRRVRSRLSFSALARVSWREIGYLFSALVAGSTALVHFWISHPISDSGLVRYHPDIVFFEGLLMGLGGLTSAENPYIAGEPLHYHWFSYAWTASVSDWANAGSFVAITRLVPLMSILGVALVGWALAKRLSGLVLVPPVVVVVVLASDYVGFGSFPGFGDFLVQGISPSHSFTTSWFLLLVLLLVVAKQADVHVVGASLTMVLLGFGIVGGKTSYAVVAAGGLVAIVARQTLGSRANPGRNLLVYGSGLLGFALGYWILIRGANGVLSLVPFPQSPLLLGLVPAVPSPLAEIVGIFSLLLASSARWVGVFLMRRLPTGNHPRIPVSFLVGLLITANLFVSFTSAPGLPEMYFELSSSVVLTVVSVTVLMHLEVATRCGINGHSVRVDYITVAAATALCLFPLMLRFLGLWGVIDIPESLRWVDPFIVWGIAITATLGPYVLGYRSGRSLTRALTMAAAVLLLCSSISLQLVNVGRTVHAVRSEDVSQSLITMNDITAARYLNKHSHSSDIVVTNRLCLDPAFSPPDCSSKFFIIPAVAERKTWISGFHYMLDRDPPKWALERIALSMKFSSEPNLMDHHSLYTEGVRWVWLDCRVNCTAQWTGIGEVVFGNGSVKLVHLGRPRPTP